MAFELDNVPTHHVWDVQTRLADTVIRNRQAISQTTLENHIVQKIRQDIDDKPGAIDNLGNLGRIHKERGLYTEAVSYYKQAIKLSTDLGNKQNEGVQLGNLGDLLIELNQIEEAEQQNQKESIYRNRGRTARVGDKCR